MSAFLLSGQSVSLWSENNPDRKGLATVWTPAAFDGLAHIRHEGTIACEDLDVFGDGWSDLGVVGGDQASNWCWMRPWMSVRRKSRPWWR